MPLDFNGIDLRGKDLAHCNLYRATLDHADKERMTETFLKYKGAQAGEVDWRPTETIPRTTTPCD